MEGAACDIGPLTMVVTWRIRKGREREFEAWRHEMSAAEHKSPGFMGSNLILPSGDAREYVVIFRFDTYENLQVWQESDIRRDLLKKAEPFQERDPSYNMECGLEYWFAPPGTAGAPPKWKMSVITVLGVWPVSMLVLWLLNPFIGDLAPPLQALLVAVGIVSLLTWAVMPALVRIFRPWLQPRL